ncbi:MAG: carbohydrate ABC transporter permease [Hyphomicrobiales bacterium]
MQKLSESSGTVGTKPAVMQSEFWSDRPWKKVVAVALEDAHTSQHPAPAWSAISTSEPGGIIYDLIYSTVVEQKTIDEAADMDGAGLMQKFWHVTLPMLWPVLLILLALLFMGGFGHFEMNYIMTGGGPRNLTNVLAVWTYQEGFQFLRFDRAAAASGLILIMTAFVSVFYLWAQSKDNRK